MPTYGVLVAIAVLVALVCALWTARKLKLDGNAVWNLGVLAIFTALVSSRLFLVLLHFRDLRKYPLWLFGLAMVSNSLVAALGIVIGAVIALLYARIRHIPLFTLADCLVPAAAFGHAIELVGCFAAGRAYGSPSSVAWAVTYQSRLAAIWSGTPLGVPLHPVQLYEAGAELLLGLILLWRLQRRGQKGELAGLWLFGAGLAHFLCELFRGDAGRVELPGGFLTVTQLFSVAMVLAGGALLCKRGTVVLEPSQL